MIGKTYITTATIVTIFGSLDHKETSIKLTYFQKQEGKAIAARCGSQGLAYLSTAHHVSRLTTSGSVIDDQDRL